MSLGSIAENQHQLTPKVGFPWLCCGEHAEEERHPQLVRGLMPHQHAAFEISMSLA